MRNSHHCMSNFIKEDNSTPEGAILLLESAYNLKNINAVFELIDFYCEAEILIKKLMPEFGGNQEIISETATALKLSLEKSLIENGWPQFDNSKIDFETESVSEDLVIVTKISNVSRDRTVVDRLYVKMQPDFTFKVAGLLEK